MDDQGVGGVPPMPVLATDTARRDHAGRPQSRHQIAAHAASYWTARMVEILMGVALVGVAVMVCMQVLFRFVLGAPLHYTEEVARYLTIWAALLGAAIGVRSGTHFSVRYLVNRLPGRVRRAVVILARLLVASFLVLFVGTSWLLLETALVQSSPAARIPLVLVYAAAPVSGVLMLFFLFTELVAGEVRPLSSEALEEDVS